MHKYIFQIQQIYIAPILYNPEVYQYSDVLFFATLPFSKMD